MANGRVGGAGQVWPDYNVNFLSKQVAYNAESSDILPGRIVSLRSTENGSALSAFLANPTTGSHWDGIWAVSRGGFGTDNGNKAGLVVQWAVVDLATDATQLDAPVYINAASPGVITLTPAAGAAVVGKVIRVGADADDTTNTVLLNPELMRHRAGNASEIQDVGDTNTFANASLVIGSGGTCILDSGDTGTRTLPDPEVAGVEVTFTATAGAIIGYTGFNGATTATATFVNPGFMTIVSRKFGSDLRWCVLGSNNVTIA
jgi:hypothetical protein